MISGQSSPLPSDRPLVVSISTRLFGAACNPSSDDTEDFRTRFGAALYRGNDVIGPFCGQPIFYRINYEWKE